MEEKLNPRRPWPKGEDRPHLRTLMDWLSEFADTDLILAGEYTVGELIEDLSLKIDNDWSDGIDAMGEDA